MTARFAATVRTFTATASLSLLAYFSGAGFAVAAIEIDGRVGGFAEEYSLGFNVALNVEDLATPVSGAQLFLHETATSLQVGFVAPLILNDNTYGTTRATDWGAKDHFLRGRRKRSGWQ